MSERAREWADPAVMIATDERCGGTTLAVIVQKLIGRRVVHDPFHPRKRRDYPASTARETMASRSLSKSGKSRWQ